MIEVTDDMVQAAIDRLNAISAADPARDTVRLPWEEVIREIYVAMEKRRRVAVVVESLNRPELVQ